MAMKHLAGSSSPELSEEYTSDISSSSNLSQNHLGNKSSDVEEEEVYIEYECTKCNKKINRKCNNHTVVSKQIPKLKCPDCKRQLKVQVVKYSNENQRQERESYNVQHYQQEIYNSQHYLRSEREINNHQQEQRQERENNNSQNYQREINNSQQSHEGKHEKSSFYNIYSITIGAVIFIAIAIILYKKQHISPIATANVQKTCSSFLEYGKKQPMEYSYFWKQIQLGVDDIMNAKSPTPAVFLLVYYDESTVSKVLDTITSAAMLCLDSQNDEVLDMPLSELQSEKVIKNYGILIDKYKPKLEQQRVMTVKNIQDVPGPVSLAFHAFSDTSGPVVEKAAIFYTMKMDENEISSNINVIIDTVERKLKSLWKEGLKKDRIDALITRMTVNVLPVKPKV